MDEQVSQFRKHARQSRELALSAKSERERAICEEIAAHWEALAELWMRLQKSKQARS